MPSSNTPQYDALIEPILTELKPGKRICKVTGNEFEIVQQEIDLLRKMKIPPPTTCPRFRRTRLGAFLNYYILYNRKSDATGKEIISEFSPKSPYKIWENEKWWSDDWSPLKYGRDYDASRPFFDQFHELDLSVPRPALFRDKNDVNSEYALGGEHLKNCYMVFDGIGAEDIMYAEAPLLSKNCIDVLSPESSENCYEVNECRECYDCQYCVKCISCISGRFLYDCHGCMNCFLCTNLRNKKYCFRNEQLSEEEYKKRVAEISLGNRTERDMYWKEFDRLFEGACHRALTSVGSEGCTGDGLLNSKNCYESFLAYNSENLVYSDGGINLRDSTSVMIDADSELLCGCINVREAYQTFFTARSRNCRFLEYSTECYQCENCFGCVGLRNKKFCILNKQYSEDEYWKLVDQIKVDMMKQGEYGEFFPLSLAPFPYQDTFAGVWPGYHALFTEEAKKHGAWITDEDLDKPNDEALPAKDFPEDIKDVQDDIIEKILLSESGEKMFRIIPRELRFYRDQRIPLPTLNFAERRDKRYKFLRPLKLFTHQCATCKKETLASLDPQTPGHVLCTECYLETIY